MSQFAERTLPALPDVVAPDGSNVRVLLATGRGSMGHFELPAGKVSRPIVHRTVDEIWFVLGGEGEMWRSQDGREAMVALTPGLCLTIPVGTRFQFRNRGTQPLTAVGVTMPPWPGDDEAVFVDGPWQSSS